MSFSPSPAPRRTVQRPPSVAADRRSPTIRRPRVAGSKPASRFATPVRIQERQPSVRDDESMVSGMDVDEGSEMFERGLRAETIFAKSREMQVTFYAHLPVEVKQVLRSADFYRDAYTGDVDTLTGFALVASAKTCFAWMYSQALTGTPTCYIFSCPQDPDSLPMATPFHALVPYGASREPGLILISPAGQVRFWDSLGMGLAGGEHFSSSSLNLDEDEKVTTLTRADSKTYIVSTSVGRLFRLGLTATGGKYHLSSHVFSRPQSALSLSRYLPSFWSSQDIYYEPGNINAVALGETDRDALGRDLWALIDFRLQRWNMSTEGWQELLMDEDIAELIRPAVRAQFASASQNDAELDLELLDLKVSASESLLVLISYAGQEDYSAMDMGITPRRIYAIVRLSSVAGSFKVDSVQAVPYQSTSSSGAPMHPRMQLVQRGKLVAIQFGDTVALCARGTQYMDRLELKSASDRTLGVGVLEGQSEIMVLTAATLMKVYVDMDEVAKFTPETGRANLIRSIMTQAILYGSIPENPLHFSFPPEIDEEALMSGAEKLSQAILESDTELVRPNHDLHAQMTIRKERLSFLIKFINDNGVLTKMSQRSRQRLATDAEKLYAAHQLWLRHNEILAAGHSHVVLTEAVRAYMTDIGEGHHEDLMRAFFRLEVGNLGSLLPHVMDVIRRASYQQSHKLSSYVPQANDIVLTILQSAVDYRNYNAGVYGIELPLINPWTSQPVVIDIVSELFDLTGKLVESQAADMEPSRTKAEAKAQLPELASTLFGCYHERLDWLGSPMAADESGLERERDELDERFKRARPEVLEILRRNGFATEAFNLAEMYRDFRSLASLCHKDTVYPPQENPNAARIQAYIDRFKEDFTTELYQWYIEHGELRTMFAQDYDGYLDKFFAQYPHPYVSWIHDLGRRRYNRAAQSLLSEAEHASELVTKHLMLSIGKLSYLAEIQEHETPVDESILDAFHDGLDFVSVHETLMDELKSVLASARGRQSLDMQVETIVKAKATKLQSLKALQNVFKQLVRQLLLGKALSFEDAADVLSLKDNDDTLDDYTTALHLLTCARNLPEARRLSAFRSVWRRIFIHDDWNKIRQTANVTDAELTDRFRRTALYAALQATMNRRHQPEGYVLLPNEALEIPTQAEISSRWPGMPSEQVAALEEDYRRESEYLAELGLEDVYERVRELAFEDLAWTAGS